MPAPCFPVSYCVGIDSFVYCNAVWGVGVLCQSFVFLGGPLPSLLDFKNYTTVDPKQFVFFKIETRACDVQSWETSVKDCKAERDTAVTDK